MAKKLLFLITIMVVSGCATDQYAQYAKPTNGSTVLVVPVGSVEATHVSTKGSAFGLLGALADNAVNSKSSGDKSNSMTKELVQAKIEDYLGQQVLKDVSKCGVTGNVQKEVVVNTDKEWVESPKSVLPDNTFNKASDVLLNGTMIMLG